VPIGEALEPIRIVVVDDRRLARIAAKAILQESPDLLWLGEAASADEAVPLVTRVRPDVVLLDVEMPGVDGPTTARRLKEVVPNLVILAWTVSDSGDDLLRMFQAGCVGYALKESGPTELRTAIKVALRNETVVPRRMLGEVLRQAADHVPDPNAPKVSLTPTETLVLKLMAKGLPSKQIATSVGTAPSSVETHIRNIYRKLDANNRAAAIGFALKRRLLRISDL
jgi:DNA-binding NarL/FixJ family response regulator